MPRIKQVPLSLRTDTQIKTPGYNRQPLICKISVWIDRYFLIAEMRFFCNLEAWGLQKNKYFLHIYFQADKNVKMTPISTRASSELWKKRAGLSREVCL